MTSDFEPKHNDFGEEEELPIGDNPDDYLPLKEEEEEDDFEDDDELDEEEYQTKFI